MVRPDYRLCCQSSLSHDFCVPILYPPTLCLPFSADSWRLWSEMALFLVQPADFTLSSYLEKLSSFLLGAFHCICNIDVWMATRMSHHTFHIGISNLFPVSWHNCQILLSPLLLAAWVCYY